MSYITVIIIFRIKATLCPTLHKAIVDEMKEQNGCMKSNTKEK